MVSNLNKMKGKKMKNIFILVALFVMTLPLQAQIWEVPEGYETRWTSFENPTGDKGKAAQRNQGAKGSAFSRIMAGDSCVLLFQEGPGIINRIWMTVSKRTPKMLRALRIKFYWDYAETPAVDVPLGDFFGNPLSRMSRFENVFFSNPEKRSFNCCIPMPYQKAAKVVFVNTSDEDLTHLFYDINFIKLPEWKSKMNYFHAVWCEEKPTKLGRDYVVLPQTVGKGRFLGISLGVFANKAYHRTWWGEGEIKFYIDGDKEFPTLSGTGVEDYIGTAWGQGEYSHRYQGCPIANADSCWWSMYRFHVQDPIYFHKDIRVTLQQIGGAPYQKVFELYRAGVRLVPTTIDRSSDLRFYRLLDEDSDLHITDKDFPQGFVNFYRQDHVTSTSYFYLDRPVR